ncbi:hypothetical protein Aph02nite_79170 [Actinoplanes philippinensis]|uniref:Uncharacterized protein n=2 Tax=Actinoplanes philippinensis TaxID=35752 RepID=A0A1I2KDM6_9ACTN|nr:hypothetical protein Aph02nite_79170 [Actinoplanes philippinensis]SFF65064.1 hypothetical protein SAMN05421541_116145 [Actinoplanes philippinensis]
MTSSVYRVTINGFRCHNETWDDALNWDGKHDEVFIDVNTRVLERNGTVLTRLDQESELMGDTSNLPGRVQAGSASSQGGIITGDKVPAVPEPWRRHGPINSLRFPPYTIFEGPLDPDRVVMLTPTIWEWDPGAGFWDGWLDWQIKADAEYGKRAKEIVGNVWPVTKPIFDAVSLGIQTVGSMAGLWSPLGKAMRRPIGTQRDPANPDGGSFNPVTIALTAETAEFLATSNLQGFGTGITSIRYADDPFLRGVYSIYLQVEKLHDGDDWADAGHANGVIAMTAADGRLYCATNDGILNVRPASTTEVNWQPIGAAPAVTGLAATGGRLFATTSGNTLLTQDAAPVIADWATIGHANAVVGLTALDGTLYCATTDNKLWARPPVLSNVNWTHIGHANGVRALAAGNSHLYALTGDGQLWKRPPVHADIVWQPVGQAPQARALAAVPGSLFAATTADRLLRRAMP